MQVIDVAVARSQIDLGRDELLILNNALNEVCNGVALFEFETRIGATRDRVVVLLKEIGTLLDEMESSKA
jgi:hypothetical protein